jgi:membrane-bound ClpP family serine protease
MSNYFQWWMGCYDDRIMFVSLYKHNLSYVLLFIVGSSFFYAELVTDVFGFQKSGVIISILIEICYTYINFLISPMVLIVYALECMHYTCKRDRVARSSTEDIRNNQQKTHKCREGKYQWKCTTS